MRNTLQQDIALLAFGEYGDMAESYDCYLMLEAIFRKHKPHLSGRAIEPISLLRGLHAELVSAYPDAVNAIDGLGRPASALVLTDTVAHACADLINELMFYLRDQRVIDIKQLKPDPEIAQILELV